MKVTRKMVDASPTQLVAGIRILALVKGLRMRDSSLGGIRFLNSGAKPRHREGDNVNLNFPPASALIFDKASGRRMDARIAA